MDIEALRHELFDIAFIEVITHTDDGTGLCGQCRDEWPCAYRYLTVRSELVHAEKENQ